MSALTDAFDAIANAIRLKKGVSTKYTPTEMPNAIASIPSGTDTSDATLDSGSRMLSGYTAYADGTKYTGSMANRGAVTGTVEAGSFYTIQQGYHDGNGTVKGTVSLSGNASESDVLADKTFYSNSDKKKTGNIVTRSASDETISEAKTYDAGYYPSNWTVTPSGTMGEVITMGTRGTIGSISDTGFTVKGLVSNNDVYYQAWDGTAGYSSLDSFGQGYVNVFNTSVVTVNLGFRPTKIILEYSSEQTIVIWRESWGNKTLVFPRFTYFPKNI